MLPPYNPTPHVKARICCQYLTVFIRIDWLTLCTLMTKSREECLSVPQGSDVQLEIVQQLVEDDIELIRIGR